MGTGGRHPCWILAAVVVVPLAAFLFFLRPRAREEKSSAPMSYETRVRPLLAKYCTSCHGPTKKKANLDLTLFRDEASVAAARKTWKKLWDQLQAREMPPEDKLQPTVEEREFLANWIEAALDRANAAAPPDPGRVVIRRLNRVEYRNTIRDLIGVAFDPTEDFPHDDVGYGFDNIGDVLSLPPLLMEKYFAAAEKILDKAIVSADTLKPKSKRLNADAMEASTTTGSHNGLRILFGNGDFAANVDLAQTGQYGIRVRAAGDQAGNEPVKVMLKLDGREVKTIDVPATRAQPKVYEEKIAITGGRHRIAAAFI